MIHARIAIRRWFLRYIPIAFVALLIIFGEMTQAGDTGTGVETTQESSREPMSDKTQRGDGTTCFPSPIDKNNLISKLNSIILKAVDFDNLPLKSAVDHLIELSRKADHLGDGVNIVLIPTSIQKTNENITASAPASVQRADGASDVPSNAAPDTSSRKVSLNLRAVSLLTAIKCLAQVGGLKIQIESQAVLIGSAEVFSKPQTRTWSLVPGFFRSHKTPVQGGEDQGEDVKALFGQCGISFPSWVCLNLLRPRLVA